MTPLPSALVSRLALAHIAATDVMLELHRLREDARAAGADEDTLAHLDALQMAADTAWRLARQEHARHDPIEAAAQEEGALAAGLRVGLRVGEMVLAAEETPHAR